MKSGRAAECIAVSPGMVLSMMVWGRSFMNVFKEQKGEDLQAFDIGILQMGTRSMQSNAAEKGQMLEIKAFMKNYNKGLTPGSIRLLHPKLVSSSLQESAMMNAHFSEGSHLGVEVTGLNQALMKGNMSSTVSVVRVALEKGQGTFAIGPDDVFFFNAAQPLADMTCSRVNVKYDTQGFGAAASKDWVCKLFNVLCLAGCMELVVVLDAYKASNNHEEEVAMDGFARPNMSVLLATLLEKKPKPISEVPPFVHAALPAVKQNVGVYELSEGLMVAIDIRRMTKRSITAEEARKNVSVYSLVHPNAEWEKGYAIHFFYDNRLVHCAVVPVCSDVLMDGSKHVLNTISAVKWSSDDQIEFEEVSAPPPDAPNKDKKRKQRPATTTTDDADI